MDIERLKRTVAMWAVSGVWYTTSMGNEATPSLIEPNCPLTNDPFTAPRSAKAAEGRIPAARNFMLDEIPGGVTHCRKSFRRRFKRR